MKLTQEEWARIDDINKGSTVSGPDSDFLLQCLDKLRPQSRERFTYKMRDCLNCDGSGNVSAAMSSIDCDVENCPVCDGLGKVRVKVKSKVHNA